MDMTVALRSIQYDLLEYIQRKVAVDFDNAKQMPVSFAFNDKTHWVNNVMGRFRTGREYPLNAFLVTADGDEIFFLYFQQENLNRFEPIQAGFWVLGFRILGDRELMALYRKERKMLVNMEFKRVVDFHGHLCPDLAIGSKLCEYVWKLMESEEKINQGLSIIAENTTSALDAIQVLLGMTVGNQRLLIMDFGKHNYTLSSKHTGQNIRFSLKQQDYGDAVVYNSLETKIVSGQAMLEDVVQFQSLLDDRVKRLLAVSAEELFDMKYTEADQFPTEAPSVYLTCCNCGEQVLKTRIVTRDENDYCIPCFQTLKTGCMRFSLQ